MLLCTDHRCNVTTGRYFQSTSEYSIVFKYLIFRLYSQLEEVKQKKEEEDRKAFYAHNREKRRDYEKVVSLDFLITVL